MPKKEPKPPTEAIADESAEKPVVKQTKKPKAPKAVKEVVVIAPPTEPKAKRKIHPMDVIGFSVVAVVIVVLSITLNSKLNLKHEVANAQVPADKVAHDIAVNNVADARKLANKGFLADPSNTASMSKFFKSMSEIYSKTTPTVAAKIVGNNATGQNVAFVYEYDRLKLPYYVRIDVVKPAGSSTWQLRAIHSNTSKDVLVGND